MDLIQQNGQPRYGRFKQLPTSIQYHHYQYKSPYGDVLSGWRKRLKYKKFKFQIIDFKPLYQIAEGQVGGTVRCFGALVFGFWSMVFGLWKLRITIDNEQ